MSKFHARHFLLDFYSLQCFQKRKIHLQRYGELVVNLFTNEQYIFSEKQPIVAFVVSVVIVDNNNDFNHL